MATKINNRLLTLKESAHLLKLHWQTVRGYVREGQIPALKAGRSFRIKESDVVEFMSSAKYIKKPLLEIELRFLANDRNTIERRLLAWKAKVIYQGHIVDHWYIPKEIKNIEEKNEWFDSGRGFGLRVREQDNGYTGKIETSLEVKKVVTPYQHNTCIEAEVTANDYRSLLSMLNLMNFKEMTVLEKDRLVYKLDDLKIVIDDIKNFRVGVEIECVSDKRRGPILAKMRNLAFKLGLDLKKDLTEKSVTFLYMEKFSRF